MRTPEEIESVMKRCQRGTTNYNDANELHADCYGMIGALWKRVQELESKLEQDRFRLE